MTTPSRDVALSLEGLYTYITKYFWRGVQDDETSTTRLATLAYESDRRPSSAPTVLLNDGSRTSTSWYHFAARSHAIRGTVDVYRNDWPREYRWYLNRVCPYNLDPRRFCLTMGQGWICSEDGYYFPYDVESLARTKAISALIDQKADLGVMLAEARKTIEGVASLTHDLVDFVSVAARLARASPRSVVRLLRRTITSKRLGTRRRIRQLPSRTEKEICNRFLEFQFGIRPTVMDIQASQALLDEMVNTRDYPAIINIKGRHSTSEIVEGICEAVSDPVTLGFRQLAFLQSRCSVDVSYEVDVMRGITLQQMGVTNSLSVGWELIPFSWLIDYAIGIGDWLKTLFPVEGASLRDGSITHYQLLETVGGAGEIVWSNQTITRADKLFVPYRVVRMSRTIIDELLPAWRPAFRSSLGYTRMANATAALRQLTR